MGLVVLIFLPYIPLVWRQRWAITDAGAAEESRVSNGSGGREHSLLCCWIGGWFTVNPVDLKEFFFGVPAGGGSDLGLFGHGWIYVVLDG